MFGAAAGELVLGAAVGGVVAEAAVAEAAGADGVSTVDLRSSLAISDYVPIPVTIIRFVRPLPVVTRKPSTKSPTQSVAVALENCV